MYDLAWRIVNEHRSEAMKCVSVAQFQQNSRRTTCRYRYINPAAAAAAVLPCVAAAAVAAGRNICRKFLNL